MMKSCLAPLIVGFLPLLGVAFAQNATSNANPVRVVLIKMPYVGERNVPDTSRGPDYLE